jgi:hypothetical protein
MVRRGRFPGLPGCPLGGEIMNSINEILAELFRSHGVPAVLQEEVVVLTDRNWRAVAAIVTTTEFPAGTSVQLDVRLEIAPGRTIVESFAGVGETHEKAVGDALRNFAVNSLHVLLAAFFLSDDSQVLQEEWLVGGRTSRVTVGNIGVRGDPPVRGAELTGWFKHFEHKLKEAELRPGTHWVRLYYAQADGKAMTCEVLLDNDVWAEMQSEMAAVAWPSGDQFYSVRVFLVIDVQLGGPVSPDTAVAWLADIIAPQEEFTQNEACSALAVAGVPGELAERAYLFMQIAWAQSLLTGLGVQVSPEYRCSDSSGTIVESGRLADEPCFAAASRLAARYSRTPGFKRLVLTSAGVRAVNDLLNKGSKPEDLGLTPTHLFLEAPSAAGMENAHGTIARSAAALRGPANSGPSPQ